VSDPLLEEANRRAHRLCRAYIRHLKAFDDFLMQRPLDADLDVLKSDLLAALKAYEEIEHRRMKEATA
jgi:hypothetical protein